MLQKAYRELRMSKTQSYEWDKTFKDSRKLAVYLPRLGRPLMSTTDENIHKIENRRMRLRELAQEVKISFKFFHNIMSDILRMKRFAA